jgi:hypothetical protein
MSPDQVDKMSFWQLNACVDGVNEANSGGPKIEPPSDEEFEAMQQRLLN